jgi:4'-phosphopantetheinyl transferase
VRFERGEHGKPYLPGSGLHFNMSDSGDVALYAVALDMEVGVDVERIRDIDTRAIASRFLPAAEAGAVSTDPADFFRIWTRREAYLKCIGIGLGAIGEEIPSVGWFIADLDPAPGYAGAVAIQGAGARVVVRDYSED